MEIDLLIADADESLRDLYQQYFSRQGLDVETAADGLECLAKLRTTKPQILIIDESLFSGGSDGVLSLMRDDCGTPRIPLVITTGDETPTQLSQLTGLPVSCCFRKPYRFTALLECISAMENRCHDGLAAENAVPTLCNKWRVNEIHTVTRSNDDHRRSRR